MREIALDTETTGISPKEGHRIIEIGAVEMVNQYRTGNHFHVYINPKRSISEGAFRVHGISEEFLADKPIFEDVIDDFLEFIADSKLIIHNAPFDMGFINHHLFHAKRPDIKLERVFDTLALARQKFPGAKNNLDALCSRFNIDGSARTKHGALLDAELLADVYAEMVGTGANQRNLVFAGNNIKIETKKDQKVSLEVSGEKLEARNFPANEEELRAHEEFIALMENSLWKKTSAS
ncbi:MAG: DNA polymerase III subunit epsilon [Alphaproteobacteria bacterium CG11_big_fil_rev_8_21_14_0_20_44_7]|nr:MAG: DNA polymerase III subunit epsilon [Alphaproteobacteria bacterium CG11_big_fil_rev_8_21_14_0_20_44_7]